MQKWALVAFLIALLGASAERSFKEDLRLLLNGKEHSGVTRDRLMEIRKTHNKSADDLDALLVELAKGHETNPFFTKGVLNAMRVAGGSRSADYVRKKIDSSSDFRSLLYHYVPMDCVTAKELDPLVGSKRIGLNRFIIYEEFKRKYRGKALEDGDLGILSSWFKRESNPYCVIVLDQILLEKSEEHRTSEIRLKKLRNALAQHEADFRKLKAEDRAKGMKADYSSREEKGNYLQEQIAGHLLSQTGASENTSRMGTPETAAAPSDRNWLIAAVLASACVLGAFLFVRQRKKRDL